MTKRKQLKFSKLETGATSIAYSPCGRFLAIGFMNGQLTVLDANTFAVKALKKDRTEQISEIKFNPQTSLLAVGSHDKMIFIYDVAANFKIKRKCRGHHSTITHFDFSCDGSILKSNCTSYEILFFDCNTGKNLPSGASSFKDETWASDTCVLGWAI